MERKGIQKQISWRWNPFSDFAFGCKSEIRILNFKSGFPNPTHPLVSISVSFADSQNLQHVPESKNTSPESKTRPRETSGGKALTHVKVIRKKEAIITKKEDSQEYSNFRTPPKNSLLHNTFF